MEPEASPFETFEMLAAVLTSAPLLSRSWQICSVATATAPNGFLMESLGDVGYVGFSSIQILAGGSNQNYRDMVPLNTSSEGLFSPLYRNKEGEEPPMVHAGMLHLFMSMFKSSDFQDQMAAIMRNSKSIIITGHSIGGTTASLCALWLLSYLQTISSTMSVLCITFGSPLLGNEAFSKATLQERWGGNFCHVVSKQDIMPRLLFAPVESLTAKLHSLVHFWHMSFTSPDYQKLGIQLPKKDQDDLFHFVKAYLEMAAAAVQEDEVPSPNVFRPFGSYVFVSEEGAVCVDGAKAVTKMMNAIYADSNPSCSINDHLKYGDYISKVCAQFMQQRNSVRWKIPDSSYEAGLELALQSSGISSQEESVLIYAKECLRMARKRMGRAPTLNAANLAVSLAKINPYRAQIEWYKATCDESDDQMGYYDSFKRRASKRDMRVNVNRMRLARFWDDVIEMLEDNQLPHDFDKRAKWFNASQSYKLLVEPLDIAEYYRKGTHKEKGHYMKHGRERRYSIFDKWWKNRTVPAEDINQRSKLKIPFFVFFRDSRNVFKLDTLGKEILGIAFPAALAVAADPIASLIDTAFIGHIGAVELAAAGVSIALFNQASRIFIFPLVSITTSFVAEEDTIGKLSIEEAKRGLDGDSELKDLEKGSTNVKSMPVLNNDKTEPAAKCDKEEYLHEKDATTNTETNNDSTEDDTGTTTIGSNKSEGKIKIKRRHIASASTALLFGTILGLFQAAMLILLAKPLLHIMGVKHGSPMMIPARKYLRLRSLGAPAVLLSLAMQGIFRGFKDTKTPLFVLVLGYGINVILDPVLIFACKLGLSGAAISHVLSQYVMAFVLFMILMRKVDLMPPSIKDLQFSRFLKNGGLLLARVVAVTFCVTLAAALAARLGSTPMAAFQTCLQIWLTSSLLADGLAVAVQAILACSFAEKDYNKATSVATRVLQMGFVLGVGLSLVVGIGLYFGAGIFSRDVHVLHLIRIGLPFVAATQPINSLAFVFDGVNFGASDFAYSAYSLVMVSIASIASLFLLYKSDGFFGIWIALTIYMGLRTFAGVWRMGTGTGPWRFLRAPSLH